MRRASAGPTRRVPTAASSMAASPCASMYDTRFLTVRLPLAAVSTASATLAVTRGIAQSCSTATLRVQSHCPPCARGACRHSCCTGRVPRPMWCVLHSHFVVAHSVNLPNKAPCITTQHPKHSSHVPNNGGNHCYIPTRVMFSPSLKHFCAI